MGCLPPINWCFLPSTVCSWRHAIESASFLHLTAGGLWVHGDGVGVAGRQAMPCNLSTQKRTNRVEDFVEEDFVEFMLSLCWVYVEFTLACSWMTFRPWATVQIWRLGQSWNSLWISQGFPIDFHKGTIISPRKRVQSSTEFWKWKKVRAPQLAEKVGDRNQDKRLATLRTFKKKNFGNSNFQILIL